MALGGRRFLVYAPAFAPESNITQFKDASLSTTVNYLRRNYGSCRVVQNQQGLQNNIIAATVAVGKMVAVGRVVNVAAISAVPFERLLAKPAGLGH
jgi:hypothetical protein